jgi:Methyltransferase domain
LNIGLLQSYLLKIILLKVSVNSLILQQSNFIKDSLMINSKHVQYGCAWSAPRSWRNFDASLTLRFERIPVLGGLYTKNATRFPPNAEYGDIVKGLPVRPGTCEAIYCCHVLEHLSLEDCRTAIKNTYSLLSPGGVFRLVVPDLEVLANAYVASKDKLAAITFMQDSFLGLTSRSRGLTGMLRAWLGNSAHLWMWDYKSLQHELDQAGFINIRRCEFGDADDPLFADVEDRDRFINAVAIEARKPG